MRENMASIMRDKPKGVREKSRDVMDDGSLGLWDIADQVYIPPHRQSGGANRERLCLPERSHRQLSLIRKVGREHVLKRGRDIGTHPSTGPRRRRHTARIFTSSATTGDLEEQF